MKNKCRCSEMGNNRRFLIATCVGISLITGSLKAVASEVYSQESSASLVCESTTGHKSFVAKNYPGGERALIMYVSSNIHYPLDAQRANLQGYTVTMRVLIDKDGTPRICDEAKDAPLVYSTGVIPIMGIKSVEDGSVSDDEARKLLDKQVETLLTHMPKWQNKKHKPVAVEFAFKFAK